MTSIVGTGEVEAVAAASETFAPAPIFGSGGIGDDLDYRVEGRRLPLRDAEHSHASAWPCAGALETNPEAERRERAFAWAAATASWVSALNIPIASQLFGISATGLGLWRDEFGDERRNRAI